MALEARMAKRSIGMVFAPEYSDNEKESIETRISVSSRNLFNKDVN